MPDLRSKISARLAAFNGSDHGDSNSFNACVDGILEDIGAAGIPNGQGVVDMAEAGVMSRQDADAVCEWRLDCRFREEEIGGVVDAAGNVTSDADSGL